MVGGFWGGGGTRTLEVQKSGDVNIKAAWSVIKRTRVKWDRDTEHQEGFDAFITGRMPRGCRDCSQHQLVKCFRSMWNFFFIDFNSCGGRGNRDELLSRGLTWNELIPPDASIECICMRPQWSASYTFPYVLAGFSPSPQSLSRMKRRGNNESPLSHGKKKKHVSQDDTC